MFTNKKKIGMTLLSATLAAALAGCGSSNNNGNSPSGSSDASASTSPGTSPSSSSGASSSGGSATDKFTLRIAMASPGDELIKVWQQIADQYQSQHPNVKVEYTFQDDDTYQTIGLPNLLSGKNAPDLYFEWAGQRLSTRVQDGFAADITDDLASSGLKDMFTDGDFKGMVFDGKTYMIPTNGDVSNVIWYNKKIFSDLNLQPPTTWDEFLAACAKIKEAGITPIVAGNKDLWPAGNWIGHLISRVVGEQAYSDALQLKQPFDSPDFVTAYGYVKQLWDNKYINDSVNALADNEGDVLFFNGKGAMHPIGSWLVSSAAEEAPDLDMGYFNLPAMPGGKGDQGSVIGVLNGMVVNAKSEHKQDAIDFMKLYSSESSSKLLAAAGSVPIAKGGLDPDTTNPLSLSLDEMMKNSSTLVSPPDTGYSVEVANALNTATSQVLGGAKSPEDALAQLDKTIAPLKK
jgi:ABC-type glycerol-3-phosphate transport system substrate-binding protein